MITNIFSILTINICYLLIYYFRVENTNYSEVVFLVYYSFFINLNHLLIKVVIQSLYSNNINLYYYYINCIMIMYNIFIYIFSLFFIVINLYLLVTNKVLYINIMFELIVLFIISIIEKKHIKKISTQTDTTLFI